MDNWNNINHSYPNLCSNTINKGEEKEMKTDVQEALEERNAEVKQAIEDAKKGIMPHFENYEEVAISEEEMEKLFTKLLQKLGLGEGE